MCERHACPLNDLSASTERSLCLLCVTCDNQRATIQRFLRLYQAYAGICASILHSCRCFCLHPATITMTLPPFYLHWATFEHPPTIGDCCAFVRNMFLTKAQWLANMASTATPVPPVGNQCTTNENHSTSTEPPVATIIILGEAQRTPLHVTGIYVKFRS